MCILQCSVYSMKCTVLYAGASACVVCSVQCALCSVQFAACHRCIFSSFIRKSQVKTLFLKGRMKICVKKFARQQNDNNSKVAIQEAQLKKVKHKLEQKQSDLKKKKG